MEEEKYYVISTSADGIYVHEMTKEHLLKELGEDASGFDPHDVLDEIPSDADPDYWGDSLLIIKGKVVSPKAVTAVTSWDIG